MFRFRDMFGVCQAFWKQRITVAVHGLDYTDPEKIVEGMDREDLSPP